MSNYTIREKRSCIIGFIFYFSINIFIIWLLIQFIIPNIFEIEKAKDKSLVLSEQLVDLDKNGVGFSKLKSEYGKNLDDKYLSEIFKNLDKKFFDKNLKNNTSDKNYINFLKDNSRSALELNKKNNRDKFINSIIPIYNIGGDTNSKKNYLTDYKFVSYIESIIETFSLLTDSAIGIESLIPLEGYNNQDSNSLDPNIFYVPVYLEISGNKKSILDFIYFTQNVGKIGFNSKDVYIQKNFDEGFKNLEKMILRGQKNSIDYNIFKNYIFDIDKIEFNEYISSDIERIDTDFVSYIKDKQGNEKYGARIYLRFYLKTISNFEMETAIKNFIFEINSEKKKLPSLLKNKNINYTQKQSLNSINLFFDEIQKKVIPSFQKSISKKENLNEIYIKMLKYKNTFDINTKILGEIINSLGNT